MRELNWEIEKLLNIEDVEDALSHVFNLSVQEIYMEGRDRHRADARRILAVITWKKISPGIVAEKMGRDRTIINYYYKDHFKLINDTKYLTKYHLVCKILDIEPKFFDDES